MAFKNHLFAVAIAFSAKQYPRSATDFRRRRWFLYFGWFSNNFMPVNAVNHSWKNTRLLFLIYSLLIITFFCRCCCFCNCCQIRYIVITVDWIFTSAKHMRTNTVNIYTWTELQFPIKRQLCGVKRHRKKMIKIAEVDKVKRNFFFHFYR